LLHISILIAAHSLLASPVAGRDIHQRVLPSLALIDAGAEGRGSGFVIDVDRKWLVTNYHVVGNAKTVDILFPVWLDGELLVERDVYQANFRQWKHSGRVLRCDPKRDLALIKVATLPKSAKTLPLASSPASPGDPVFLLGNRRDLDQLWCITSGHVRQSFRSDDGYPWRTERLAKGCRLLAVQAAINEGDSGGPVVNSRGELVGVAAAILWPAQRSAAAIDLAEVRTFVFPDQPLSEPVPASDLYRQMARGVCWVQAPSSTSRATGWIFDKERKLLVTTATAAGPHELIDVAFPLFDGERVVSELSKYPKPSVPARVVARDLRRNLAILEAMEMPANSREWPIAADSTRPGDVLHTIGNPGGFDVLWVYTAVHVRQRGSVVLSPRKEDGPAKVLVLQAPAAGNDSGGPVFDDAGKVVAVAGGKEGAEQQVSFAVDLAELRDFLRENKARWSPQSAAELHQRGKQRMRVRWLDAALADFTASLQVSPKYEPTYADLAELYRLRGELNDGRAIANKALELVSPANCAAPLCVRAAIYLDRGDIDKAQQDCDTALKIDPKCARAFAERAEVWRRKKDLDKALKDAGDAIWLDANLARAYLHRGLARIDLRDWQQAIADLTRAAELEPFDPQPLRLRAGIYEEIGEPKKAAADQAAADRLVKAKPKH
jgi:S1-C subfamily serine protease/Tfp pilus assembly protein PilF